MAVNNEEPQDSSEPIFEDPVEPIFEDPAELTFTDRPKEVSRPQFVFGCGFLVLLTTAALWFIGKMMIDVGLHPLLAYPLAGPPAAIVVVVLIGVLATWSEHGVRGSGALIVAHSKTYFKARFHILLRLSERHDFQAARKASGEAGRTFQFEQLSVWTNSPDEIESQIAGCFHETLKSFANMTRFPCEMPGPLRVLCIASEAAFLSYTRSAYPSTTRYGGYYSGIFRKKIVICGELAKLGSLNIKGVFAHELAHFLLNTNGNGGFPPWISEGVATTVQKDIDESCIAKRVRYSFLRAENLRNRLLSCEVLTTTTYPQLLEHLSDWNDLTNASWGYRFYVQSKLLCAHLARSYPGEFRSLLDARRESNRKSKVAALIQRIFRRSADELMSECLERCLDEPLPDYERPPETAQRHIETQFVGTIRNTEIAVDERRMAIRCMGFFGYPWRADVLIDLLDDTNGAFRAEAAYALRNIAGDTIGYDRQVWLDWYHSLPDRVIAKREVF